MMAPLSSTARRRILLALAFVVAILLSYFGIRGALADHYAALQTLQGYERATRLEPGNFQYWHLLGRYWQYNFEDADTSRAIRAYTTALALNPLDAETWSDLATAYEAEGNLLAARGALQRAKRAYPLSPEVSWRYGNFLLRQGELDAAFLEIRHAVEVDPKRGAEALSRSLRVEPNIDLLLDRVLPQDSTAYLYAIQDQTADGHTENALKIWRRLAALRPRMQLSDSYSLIESLRSSKRFLEARQVWDQTVAFAGLANISEPIGSVLWDGGFESGAIRGSFAWAFPQGVRGVQISIDAHEKHAGSRSLQLLFNGKFNLQLVGPCHDVPVEPSTAYRFSGWVRTEALSTDQGIRFQLRPLGTPDSPITVTPDLHGTHPWTVLETSWSSGKDVHEAQICIERYASREADDKIQGLAWVDDVALVPQIAEPAKP